MTHSFTTDLTIKRYDFLILITQFDKQKSQVFIVSVGDQISFITHKNENYKH